MLQTRRLLTRWFPAAAVCGLLALGLVGCGDDGSIAVKTPERREVSASTSPEAAPTLTPRPKPLSPYEDAPQVAAARKWAAAAARDVTAGRAQLTAARKFMTGKGRQIMPTRFSQEIGLRYPGPVPFTPVAVRADGDVVTCMWVAGWGRAEATGKPAERKKVVPMRIDMDRVRGKWRVSDLLYSEADCGAVDVRGVRW